MSFSRHGRSIRWILAAALCAGLAPANSAPAKDSASFVETMQWALASNPLVNVAATRARSTGYELQRARAKHLPTLSVNTAPITGGSQPTVGAVASLNLWAAGAIGAQVEQQKASFRAGRELMLQACTEALQLSAEAYVNVLRADARTQLWQDHLARYDDIRSMVSQIAEVDRGRRVDVEQVLTRMGIVELSLTDARSQARQARLALNRMVGRAVEPREEALDTLATRLTPAHYDDAMVAVHQANPALQAGRHEIDAARHAVDVARGARWPQLNLVLQNTRDRVGGVRTNDTSVGLQAQWNLFNGGSDFYAEKASLESVQAAQARLEEIQRAVELDVAQAWEAASTARQRARIQGDQARPAAAVLEANRELFRLGRRSVLDILNAANDVHAIRLAQVEARHDAWQYSFRLSVLTGRLLADLRLPAQSPCGAEGVAMPLPVLGEMPGF